MSVSWFGDQTFAPVCNETQHVATPVGELCEHCEEPFVEGDFGFVLPFVDHASIYEAPFHYACHMRSIIGSVAHQMKICSCFVPGSTADDPPQMSKREAAALAVDLWEHNQRQEVVGHA